MRVVIIIPTYNEAGNIASLLEKLQAQFLGIDHEMSILVVDDNSPDGTGRIVEQLKAGWDNLHLIVGKKLGLGAAYLRGMRHALSELQADVVFEMDADFSHDPADVKRLMMEIDKGADFVIGSRYVDGGSIPDNWGPVRSNISRGGNLVARYLAGLSQVRDCTAGFRAIRASVLREIDLGMIAVQGYAFQVVLLHAALASGAKVKEIPVHFVDRSRGESKLGLPDIVEFIINAWWIRMQSSRTFLMFLAVGASGVAVNLLFFSLLLGLGMNQFIASPIAIEVSIISNFFLNNSWTFKSRKSETGTHIRGLKFNVVSLVALCISYGAFVSLSLLFPAVPPQVHQLIGIVPATLVNYFLNSYWTFRESKGQK